MAKATTLDVIDATYVTSKWWVLTLRGVLLILAGIAFVFWPGITLKTLVYLFGAYVLVAGILSIMDGLLSIGKTKGGTWVLTVLLGFIQLGIGVYLFRHPQVTFAAFVLLIGFALIAHAVFEIIGALAGKGSTSTSKMLTIVGGVVSGFAGIIVLAQPAASGVAFVWVLGIFALINGPIAIALSLDLKRAHEELVAAN